MNVLKFIILLLALTAIMLPACGNPQSAPVANNTPTTKGGNPMQWSNPPAMSIDKNKQYTATIIVKWTFDDKEYSGDIKAELYPKDAPNTVNNFVFLARQGFYNGVVIHRIVKGFVLQTGDPKGNGSGGPGYKFADEKITRDYVEGTLAMANSGPNTNGSQFFITLANLSGRLPKNYTIFGKVTSGMDVVKKIGDLPVKANFMGEQSTPTVDVHVESITIAEQ